MPYGGKNPAAKGQGGDTELGHLTPGEIILPREFPQQRPDLFAEIAEFLGNDIGRRTVGGGDDSINPDTGYPEFYSNAFGGTVGQAGAAAAAAAAAAGRAGIRGIQSGLPASHSKPTANPSLGWFGQATKKAVDDASMQQALDVAISRTKPTLDYYDSRTGDWDLKGMLADHENLGLAPGEISRENMLTKSFMPEIFGPFQGLVDPRTQQEVSPAQLRSMSLADFNALSGNPDTSYIGDENSPFGMAMLGGMDLFSAISNPLQFAITKAFESAATGENISLGGQDLGFGLGPGILGGEGGEGILGDFGGWLSGLTDTSPFGPRTESGARLNRGGGPGVSSPAAGAPAPLSSSQLLEQLNAGIATPEQREAATAEAFSRLSGQTGQNPFTLLEGGPDEAQFADVINRGLARQNERLIDPLTFGGLSNAFGDESLLSNILTEEGGIQREGFTSDLGSAFPGDAFGEIDDSIIDSIIEERIGPARQQVSNFAARNLSAPGGVGANEFLAQQETEARERLGEIGGNVQSLNQLGVNAIRDTARSGISDFQLGDRFDVAPFAEQRQSLVDERTGSFGEDVRTQLGSEPLFDVSGALSAGSRAGGLVSGPQQESQGLLDVIAERELAGRTSRRGLQRSGSGAF